MAGRVIKNWKRRYFVLKDGALAYYETENVSGGGAGCRSRAALSSAPSVPVINDDDDDDDGCTDIACLFSALRIWCPRVS